MTSISIGPLGLPVHSIISTETRAWLGIDTEDTAAVCNNDCVLGGVRTFTNLPEQEQWLSMHQCIDVECPVHGSDKFSKSFLQENKDSIVSSDSESVKCRRKLFDQADDAGIVSQPRFICTWLDENVPIGKYPLYKLSVVCSSMVPSQRKDYGLYSKQVTDCIWTSHRYTGDINVEILQNDNVLSSSCRKSRSLESCLNETPLSVIKDICDVDITDIKKKYSFLFDPKYIYAVKNKKKHTCHRNDTSIPLQNDFSQHNVAFPNSSVEPRVIDNLLGNYGTDCLNFPGHLQLNLMNGFQQIHPYSPHHQIIYNQTMSPVTGYKHLTNLNQTLPHLNSPMVDPRLQRPQYVNDVGRLNVYSSLKTYKQNLSERSKYDVVGDYHSNGSHYQSGSPLVGSVNKIMSPLVGNASEYHDSMDNFVWSPNYMTLSDVSSFEASPLMNTPLDSPNVCEQTYHGAGENGHYSQWTQRNNSYQSSLVEDLTIRNRNFSPKTVSPYANRHIWRPHRSTTRSRSNSPEDGSVSCVSRDALADEYDKYYSGKRSCSSSPSISGKRSRHVDHGSRGKEQDTRSSVFRSRHSEERFEDDRYMHDPIPRYLSSDRHSSSTRSSKLSQRSTRDTLELTSHSKARLSSRDKNSMPFCKERSTYRRSICASRDIYSPTRSRSRESFGRGSFFKKDDRQRSRLSRNTEKAVDSRHKNYFNGKSTNEYLRDRQKRSEHRKSCERKTSSKSPRRSRSSSQSSKGRRLETCDLRNVISRPFGKRKICDIVLNRKLTRVRGRSPRNLAKSRNDRHKLY